MSDSLEPTQVTYPIQATIRTVVQVVIGMAPVMPFLVADLGLQTTGGVVAIVLAASAVITRLMAVPAVNRALGRYLRLGADPLA